MIAAYFQAVGTSPFNTLLHTRRSTLLSSHVFHASVGISSRPEDLWFDMVLMLASSSARMKSPTLNGSCSLMMVWVGSSDGSSGLPSSSLKWVSKFWGQVCSVLPTTLIFHEDLLLLIFLTVSHTILDLFWTAASSILIICLLIMFCSSCLFVNIQIHSMAIQVLLISFLWNFLEKFLSQFELL